MMNFEIMEYFIWPFMIIALPLPFLVRWLLPPSSLFIKDNIPDSLRVSFFSELNQKKDVQNASAERKLKILWITCWGLLVLASMRPILPQEDPTLREVRNIMLALDYSQSMEEKDFFINTEQVSRTEAVSQVVKSFIHKRAGDRIGLVILGSKAYTLSPLSNDTTTLISLLSEIKPDISTVIGGKTALGDGLALSVKSILSSNVEKSAIILLSDGLNTSGDIPVLKAVGMAQKNKIPVYTIGIGTHRQKENKLAQWLFEKSPYGWDEQILLTIAEQTGGKYFRAGTTNDLLDVYREIDKLETTPTKNKIIQPKQELFYYPLLLALSLWFWIQYKRRSK